MSDGDHAVVYLAAAADLAGAIDPDQLDAIARRPLRRPRTGWTTLHPRGRRRSRPRVACGALQAVYLSQAGPRMLLDIAAALDLGLTSWMVGDTDADILAGKAAGCRTLLIRNPRSVHERLRVLNPDITADSLADAVERLSLC